jgi:hypothetical protein
MGEGRYKSRPDPQTRQSVSLVFQPPEVIRLVEMMRPLSVSAERRRSLFERGIDICHETVRLWWNRFADVWVAYQASSDQLNAGRGAGMSMRCSEISERSTIYGAMSIRKARSSRATSRYMRQICGFEFAEALKRYGSSACDRYRWSQSYPAAMHPRYL